MLDYSQFHDWLIMVNYPLHVQILCVDDLSHPRGTTNHHTPSQPIAGGHSMTPTQNNAPKKGGVPENLPVDLKWQFNDPCIDALGIPWPPENGGT